MAVLISSPFEESIARESYIVNIKGVANGITKLYNKK
jgi:hypothetical protein